MSSEYFTRTSLYLVRLKIFEWIKLHLHQIQRNWGGRNVVISCEFTAHYACKNEEINLKSTFTNEFNFPIINSLMESWGYAWPGLTAKLSRHLWIIPCGGGFFWVKNTPLKDANGNWGKVQTNVQLFLVWTKESFWLQNGPSRNSTMFSSRRSAKCAVLRPRQRRIFRYIVLCGPESYVFKREFTMYKCFTNVL